MGGRICPPLQRSNLNFPRGYVPDVDPEEMKILMAEAKKLQALLPKTLG